MSRIPKRQHRAPLRFIYTWWNLSVSSIASTSCVNAHDNPMAPNPLILPTFEDCHRAVRLRWSYKRPQKLLAGCVSRTSEEAAECPTSEYRPRKLQRKGQPYAISDWPDLSSRESPTGQTIFRETEQKHLAASLKRHCSTCRGDVGLVSFHGEVPVVGPI